MFWKIILFILAVLTTLFSICCTSKLFIIFSIEQIPNSNEIFWGIISTICIFNSLLIIEGLLNRKMKKGNLFTYFLSILTMIIAKYFRVETIISLVGILALINILLSYIIYRERIYFQITDAIKYKILNLSIDTSYILSSINTSILKIFSINTETSIMTILILMDLFILYV